MIAAGFAPVESSQAYLDALQAYVLAYGGPAALYSDRDGIFRKHDPEDDVPTQFQRAIDALGIEGIRALTPQAEGRVERLFQTLQDRLVKAMRLAGIKDLAGANAFLPGYLQGHNQRFAVVPAEAADAHRPYDGSAQRLTKSAPSTTFGLCPKTWCWCCPSTSSATSCRPAVRRVMACAASGSA